MYYKSFDTFEDMSVAENIVLRKLKQYKEIECRDRFILPAGSDIKLFIKAIDEVYNYFNN